MSDLQRRIFLRTMSLTLFFNRTVAASVAGLAGWEYLSPSSSSSLRDLALKMAIFSVLESIHQGAYKLVGGRNDALGDHVLINPVLRRSIPSFRNNFNWTKPLGGAMGSQVRKLSKALDKRRGRVDKEGEKNDKALLAAPGGIDLNSASLDLRIKRDGKGVPLPIAQQDMAQLSRIQGFVPHIIEIRPASALPILSEFAK